jgi:hypothetical protein
MCTSPHPLDFARLNLNFYLIPICKSTNDRQNIELKYEKFCLCAGNRLEVWLEGGVICVS